MSAPPSKKIKEGTTISTAVFKEDCMSPVTRIKGYPWRLRLQRKEGVCNSFEIFVRCEKSMEAELWNCEADIKSKYYPIDRKCKFDSTDKKSHEQSLGTHWISAGTRLDVEITPSDDGNNVEYEILSCFFIWRSRPVMGYVEPRNGILVMDDKKIYVNKESLASQSPYFDRLFNGDFKEKNMDEIPIGDVSAEEFTNLMRMLYGWNGASVVNTELTRENVHRILELADRFELKVVEEGVLNVLLSSSSPFTIHERLLIADQHGLTTCQNLIIQQYSKCQLIHVIKAPEFSKFSIDTKDSLMKRMVEHLEKD